MPNPLQYGLGTGMPIGDKGPSPSDQPEQRFPKKDACPPPPEEDPYLPRGVFQQLVAEFCTTVASLAQRLDAKLEELNEAHGRPKTVLPNIGAWHGSDLKSQRPSANPSDRFDKEAEEDKEAQESHKDKLRSLTVQEAREAMGTSGVNQHLVHKRDAATLAANFKRRRHLFTDVEAMKDQIRHAILQPYSVTNFYHRDGFCARIATSSAFEQTTLAVVALSSLWIAVDADVNAGEATKDKHVVFQIVDYAIFAFFLVEWLIRFGAFQNKINCSRDFWFCFDTGLVISMIVDVVIPLVSEEGLGFNPSIIRLARLIRISRMARIAKLLNKWPELGVLIKGIGIGARSVLSTFFLLVIVVYVFAVAFRFLTVDEDVGDLYFTSVPMGMKFLILFSTMPDAVDFVDDVGSNGNLVNGVLAFLFVGITSLTLLNMLIGVVCEVIGVVASVEKEASRVQIVKDHLMLVLSDSDVELDLDNLVITKAEFQALLVKPSVVKLLHEIGVDPVGLIDFIDYIFSSDVVDAHGHGLTFDKLVQLIVELGGQNKATVKDVIDMRQVVLRHIARIEQSLARNFKSLASSAQPHNISLDKQRSAVVPSQSLSQEEINAFLEMVASSWVFEMRSRVSESSKEEKDVTSSVVNTPKDQAAKVGEFDQLSQQLLELEKNVKSNCGDSGDLQSTSLAALVIDLQSRLTSSQVEVKQANEQISHVTNFTKTLESKLNSAKDALIGWELRADVLETEFVNLSSRTTAAEKSLKLLQSTATQDRIVGASSRAPIQTPEELLPPSEEFTHEITSTRRTLAHGIQSGKSDSKRSCMSNSCAWG